MLRSPRYLQNGNILAARTFIIHFVSQLATRRSSLPSPHQPSPIPVGKAEEGEQDEIIFTTDSAVNFAQLAVRACQRAQGEKNRVMREAWVRLCGTYQSKGGLVAQPEVRKVGVRFLLSVNISLCCTLRIRGWFVLWLDLPDASSHSVPIPRFI